MIGPDLDELSTLQRLAKLRADRARADVAAANRPVAQIRAAIDALSDIPRTSDPAAGLALERWLTWRDARLAELNRDLALAKAHAAVVARQAAREIAREEALGMLLRDAELEAKRAAERRATDTLLLAPKAPGERYQ